jgi:hypothetical protein
VRGLVGAISSRPERDGRCRPAPAEGIRARRRRTRRERDRTVCASRSTGDLTGAPPSAPSPAPAGATTGTRPIFTQFVRKMSPNDGRHDCLEPVAPAGPTGACSREEPQPKLRPVRRIFAPCASGAA